MMSQLLRRHLYASFVIVFMKVLYASHLDSAEETKAIYFRKASAYNSEYNSANECSGHLSLLLAKRALSRDYSCKM